MYCSIHNFGYSLLDGPMTWQGLCKFGKRQSPVDISVFDIEVLPLPPLLFMNYESFGDITLKNNGHTVIAEGFDSWGDKRPFIIGGGINGTYQLSQFHFHWALQNDVGSEHTVSSLHFPAELHLVHVKENPTPDEVNTIAVVGVFITLGNYTETIKHLTPFIQNIKMPDMETLVTNFSPNSLLPLKKEHFYRYEGSLTTPSCDESVVWTIMASPITITPFQVRTENIISNFNSI
ncbi:unnamed protein product [Thelazia callipaeda]|uniref:Carbonic anhydrase n=1 Tax=Thelazia callipaeda TaxID=103827 RepID=A0A0N5D8E0_THECL|nr:unnamed protein product [Thelazia callipaeda]